MSGKATMKNFKQMLAESKRPERSVEICLRGDLVASFEELERDLEAEERKALNSLGGGERTGELADQIEALRTEMAENSVIFRLRALSRPEFRAMVSAHPPRRDPTTNDPVDRDQFVGVNTDSFFDSLIRACVVEPEMDDEDWKLLLEDRLTDKQFDALSDAAWHLNRGDVDIPFSRAASRFSRSSEPE